MDKKYLDKCPICGGSVFINEEEDYMECEYCGERHSISINDSDEVKIEKAKAKFEKEKFDYQKQLDKKAEEKLEEEEFKKSAWGKTILSFAIISALLSIFSFSISKVLAGIVGILMSGAFLIAYLMGIKVIPEKKKGLHTILGIVGIVMLIPFLVLFFHSESDDSSYYEDLDWTTIVMADKIPAPSKTVGNIYTNGAEELSVTIVEYTQTEYDDYLAECKNKKYDIDAEVTDWSYEAYNEEGYKIRISIISDSLYIDLYAPIVMSEYDWPSGKIGKQLPKPNSNLGKMKWEYEDNFLLYVGNTNYDDYKAYVKKVQKSGFTVDYEKGDKYYRADNKRDYHVSVDYEGFNIMTIEIEKNDYDEW